MRSRRNVLTRIDEGLLNLRGLTRCALAAFSGALSALSFPPFQLFPLLLLGYAVLLLLLDATVAAPRSLRRAAWAGWSYGFGFFAVGLHWIGYAFLVNAEEHLWLLPFAAVFLPGGLALFYALAAAVYVRLWRPGAQRAFLFAAIFATVEWVRGHVFTGFPWNLPGYGWGASLEILQSTAILGVYGLSVLTLLFGAALALLVGPNRRRLAWLPAAMAVLFAGLWLQGAARLATASDAKIPDLRLRIVQTALSQSEKYVREFVPRNWQTLLDLTARPATAPPTHVIWPEAAPPFPLTREPAALGQVARLAERFVLLTGDVRIAQPDGETRYFNSFDIFAPGGRLIATSDKFHLVPFGEYLPFEDTLRALGITEIAGAGAGFSSGPGPQSFAVPGAPPVTPLICYEVIFPGEVTGEPRPGWLVNMSDDSWFGPRAGPEQHFLIARVRAIEEGLPIVRATNGGISAIIDPYGRAPDRLPLGRPGILDGELPAALAPTAFSQYGNVILLILVLMCVGAAVVPPRVQQI